MKMDFDLAKPFGLQVGNHFKTAAVILLGREKVCMPKRSAVVVANSVTGGSRQLEPVFKLDQTSILHRRLEVISNQEDQMSGSVGIAAGPLARAPRRIA